MKRALTLLAAATAAAPFGCALVGIRSGYEASPYEVVGSPAQDVEIRRYDANTGPDEGARVAKLPGKLCRFLSAGDVDGDGDREMVAATHRRGLWLVVPDGDEWAIELIDRDSSSFEHASILLDLDGNGRDELYVASDKQKEVRRYTWNGKAFDKEVMLERGKDERYLTWNLMPIPLDFLP